MVWFLPNRSDDPVPTIALDGGDDLLATDNLDVFV